MKRSAKQLKAAEQFETLVEAVRHIGYDQDDFGELIADLITDARHWWAVKGLDDEDFLYVASLHNATFKAESDPEYIE